MDEMKFEDEVKFIGEMRFKDEWELEVENTVDRIWIIVVTVIPIQKGICLLKNMGKIRISLLISWYLVYIYNTYLYSRGCSFLTIVS